MPGPRGPGGSRCLQPSPLSSTTWVCSLLQSTGSPMTSTSTKGSMIWYRRQGWCRDSPQPAPTLLPASPTSPRSPSIESLGLGSCCPLMIRSTSCFLSCPGRGSSALGLKLPEGPGHGAEWGWGRAPSSRQVVTPAPLTGWEPQPRRARATFQRGVTRGLCAVAITTALRHGHHLTPSIGEPGGSVPARGQPSLGGELGAQRQGRWRA